MSEIKQPYVSVSGVVSPEIQTVVEESFIASGLKSQGRHLALGVKAVHKTQFLDIENKYGQDWYPVGAQAFTSALSHDTPKPYTKAVAQTYLDVEHVGDKDYRDAFVRRIHERGQPWIQAIQFDMLPWHNDSDMLSFLENVKETTGLEILLQAHSHAMEELKPQGIVRRLARAAHVIDYLLFDASHGTGTRLDTEALRPFVVEAYEGFDTKHTGIAIAGGLNEQVVREDLPALISDYPHLSWDAEGQLHPVLANGSRPLDIDTTESYLMTSATILPRTKRSSAMSSLAILETEAYWGMPKRKPFPYC